MTSAPEKAAPFPADDAVDAVAGILASNAGRKYVISSDLEIAEEIVAAVADREARPSLPDRREERIREDERDRLYALSIQLGTSAPQMWLHSLGAMHPSARARARQGGNNG